MKNIKKLLILLTIIILSSLAGCTTETTKNNITLVRETESIVKYYEDHNFDVNSVVEGDAEYIIQMVYNVLSDANICVSYTNSRDHFIYTDTNPDNSSEFLLFYSGVSTTEWDGNYMSREHVWPQSLGHSKTEPGGHDLYNLRPEHRNVNSARGNRVYGMVYSKQNTLKYPGNSNIVCGWYDQYVFEPADDVKGDVARICFYYSIKYNFDLFIITSDDTYQEFLEWNRNDPPSEIELTRNDYVQGIQGNRNIFVDYPELADFIWGGNQE